MLKVAEAEAASTVTKPLSLIIGLAFLMLIGAAYLQVRHSSERPNNIERKAHRIADAVESLGVALPKDELVDVTDQLRALGIRPDQAMPDCPKIALCLNVPERIYVASLPVDCEGVAIAGIMEGWDLKPPTTWFHVSLVGSKGEFAYQWGDFPGESSRKKVLGLIWTLTREKIGRCGGWFR